MNPTLNEEVARLKRQLVALRARAKSTTFEGERLNCESRIGVLEAKLAEMGRPTGEQGARRGFKIEFDTPIWFGKHKGKTGNLIAAGDPWYIHWAHGVEDIHVDARTLRRAMEKLPNAYWDSEQTSHG